ncbi:MAG: ergothioneine biosynthesis protein EgtC [Actinobacteria bacterium]|nr:ergothioneine biosynthesis protein EgtC [Actinomycetota bacterium]MBI3688878.1 ergothioneine biosynthesis protein EgtC [Actinomycetota bacterium]
MCRHIAYLGSEVRLGALLVDPPFGLVRQAWAPRRQRHGTINADGFGVGWYASGDPLPARYRHDRPLWADASFQDLARVVRSTAMLAAVRDGTPGLPYGEATCAPFATGRWLFSHNGAIPRWTELAAALGPAELAGLAAPTDSAVLWALLGPRLVAGDPPADAVAETVAMAAPYGGRLNLLLGDGRQIVATAWGDSLCWRAVGSGTVVASEPFDDEAGWHEVPDRHLLHATPDGVRTIALEG